ncbi:MAG: hypothetical protein RL346_1525 [Verrucomicrobiota bacterium]|jgi:hypothetical protein
MNVARIISGLGMIPCILLSAFSSGSEENDLGRSKVGSLAVTVIYATNGDPTAAGEKPIEIGPEVRKKLSATRELRFSHYRQMGAESKPIFRSYENWAQPLKPSDEILLRFETRAEPSQQAVPLNIELWLSLKKILKSDITLRENEPLYILGPAWRGGKLIISLDLTPIKS